MKALTLLKDCADHIVFKLAVSTFFVLSFLQGFFFRLKSMFTSYEEKYAMYDTIIHMSLDGNSCKILANHITDIC